MDQTLQNINFRVVFLNLTEYVPSVCLLTETISSERTYCHLCLDSSDDKSGTQNRYSRPKQCDCYYVY